MGWCFFKHPGGLNEHAENRAHLPGQYYERQVAGKDQDWVKVCVHRKYGHVRDGKPLSVPWILRGRNSDQAMLVARITTITTNDASMSIFHGVWARSILIVVILATSMAWSLLRPQ